MKRFQEEEAAQKILSSPSKRKIGGKTIMENVSEDHLFVATKTNHTLDSPWLEEQKVGKANRMGLLLGSFASRVENGEYLTTDELQTFIPMNRCQVKHTWDNINVKGTTIRTVLLEAKLMDLGDIYATFMASPHSIDVQIGPEALLLLRKHLGCGNLLENTFVVKVLAVPSNIISTISVWPSSGLSVRIYKEEEESFNVLYTVLGLKAIREIGDQAKRYGLKAFTPPSMNPSPLIVTVKADVPAETARAQLRTLSIRNNSNRKPLTGSKIDELIILSQDVVTSSVKIVGSKLVLTGPLADALRRDLNHRQKKVIGNVSFTPFIDEDTTVKITVERE